MQLADSAKTAEVEDDVDVCRLDLTGGSARNRKVVGR